MRETQLTVDSRSGRVELAVRVNTSQQDYLNAERRKQNLHTKGFTKGGTMREVAEIPFDFLQSLAMSGDVDGLVLFNSQSDPIEKRKALRRLLFKYPEFRISSGNI